MVVSVDNIENNSIKYPERTVIKNLVPPNSHYKPQWQTHSQIMNDYHKTHKDTYTKYQNGLSGNHLKTPKFVLWVLGLVSTVGLVKLIKHLLKR